METLQNAKETKAKKEHRCSFCNGAIRAGNIYYKSIHVHDGHIYDWKSHQHCHDLSIHHNMYEDCYEGLSADIFQEYISDIYAKLMRQLLGNEFTEDLKLVSRELRHVHIHRKISYVYRMMLIDNKNKDND